MSITELLIERVKESGVLNEEALTRFLSDMETYDQSYIDAIVAPTVIVVSKYGGNTMRSGMAYVNDPWSAKSAFSACNSDDSFFVVLVGQEDKGVFLSSKENAGLVLYGAAKAAGFPSIKNFNNVSGYILSFDELRGSVPEYMRDAFEFKQFDELTGTWKQPHVEQLKWYYDIEVERLLNTMRCDSKRVEVKDKDNPEHSEWVDVPVTNISVGFNRFDQPFQDSKDIKRGQSTAFFAVSDNSPTFTPDVKFNWHCQDVSRWLYAGAICIDYSRDDNGQESIRIGSNH